MSFARRIALFLVFVGVGLVGYFVISDLAHQPDYSTFIIGTFILLVGIALLVTHPAPEAPPAPRFRTLNKIMKRDEKIDEKMEGKKK